MSRRTRRSNGTSGSTCWGLSSWPGLPPSSHGMRSSSSALSHVRGQRCWRLLRRRASGWSPAAQPRAYGPCGKLWRPGPRWRHCGVRRCRRPRQRWQSRWLSLPSMSIRPMRCMSSRTPSSGPCPARRSPRALGAYGRHSRSTSSAVLAAVRAEDDIVGHRIVSRGPHGTVEVVTVYLDEAGTWWSGPRCWWHPTTC